VELIRADNVLLKVIEQENLIAHEEFGVSIGLLPRLLAFLRIAEPQLPGGQDALGQALTQFRKAVTVQRRGLTYLISIQVRSESPETAAHLANVIAQVYIADQLASKVNSMMAARDVLQGRIAQARDAIARSEGSFDAFIADNMARIVGDTGRTDLAQMRNRLDRLTQSQRQSQSLSAQLRTSLQNDDLSTVIAGLQDAALSELERQRQRLIRDVADAGNTALEVDLRAELATIENQLRQAAVTEVNSIEQQVRDAESQQAVLRQDIRREVLNSALSGDVLTRLYELQQNADIARIQYQTLLARVQDVDAQADLQMADSRIASPALAPQLPSFPNKPLIIAIAVIFALGLGLGLAFIYENLIGGFTSEEQVASVLRMPVAATVPREKLQQESDSLADLLVTSPLSIYAESVRRIRAAIQHALRATPSLPTTEPGQTGRIIMVTSTAPNEGKTTLALSLARSYAAFGQNTLLIDCDMRKPSIHRHLGLEPATSLLDYLSAAPRSYDVKQIISQDPLSPVTVILGSHRSGVPTDQLLAGMAFERLIVSAAKTYDVVILDTPPIAPVVDGLFIAPFADVVLFIARWASSPQREARRAIAALNTAMRPDATILAALNQKDDSRASYEKRYSGYYSYNQH
jgi:capsular exopolysaccharide synthesis family protein